MEMHYGSRGKDLDLCATTWRTFTFEQRKAFSSLTTAKHVNGCAFVNYPTDTSLLRAKS